MKKIAKTKTKTIIIVPVTEQPKPPKKPKINPHLLKLICLIIVTLINVLNPEAILVNFLIKLLFVILGWLNQNKS